MDWTCTRSGTNNDRWLIEEVFPGKTDGFYLEIGLGSPVMESATWNLEQLGWDGISFEPNPQLYLQSWWVRKNKVVHAAVYGTAPPNGMIDFIVTHTEPHRSGIAAARNRRQKDRDLRGYYVTQVPCISIAAALKATGLSHIDAICIDAENSELPILSRFDNAIYKVGAWIVETCHPNALRKQMDSLGYREVKNRFNTTVHHEHYFLPKG